MENIDNNESEYGTDLFKPGNMVGRYRLLGPLATGGMAQIWAARNEQNRFGRTIVLKVIRPEYAADDEYRRMLIDEATAAYSVHHPNVCEILDLGTHENVLFLAMEWVAGDSLAGLLKTGPDRNPMPYGITARIIANACAGLHAAHEALGSDRKPLKLVHRDVSPQNILLSISGQVKVSDFGIAKARDQLHAKTRTGSIKGKFAYIPPEQVKGKPLDRRADVYAMGCVLYVATTGSRPFGSTPRTALAKILRGEFKKPSEITIEYPLVLEQIVLKAMALNPDDRYQSADAMRLALDRWLGQVGTLFTESDIAALVKSRLSPLIQQQIRALRNAPEFMREISAYRPRKSGDVGEMPTAATMASQNSTQFTPSGASLTPSGAALTPAGPALEPTGATIETPEACPDSEEPTGIALVANPSPRPSPLPAPAETPARPSRTPTRRPAGVPKSGISTRPKAIAEAKAPEDRPNLLTRLGFKK